MPGSALRAERYLRRQHDLVVLDKVLVQHCEWLKRSWTFQEIVLADNPVMVFGTRSMSWAQFMQTVSYLSNPTPTWQTWLLFRSMNPHLYSREIPFVDELDPWKTLISLWANFPQRSKRNTWVHRKLMERDISVTEYQVSYVNRWYLKWWFRLPTFMNIGLAFSVGFMFLIGG